MFLKAWRFLAILLTALTMSLAFAHLLEMPAKMALTWPNYAVVQGIYGAFGAIGSLLEVGAIIATAVLAWLLRKRRIAFRFMFGATVGLILALMIWFALVAPVNMEFVRANATVPPANWERLRSQWEYAHATRAILQILAFVAIVLVTIMDARTPAEKRMDSTQGGGVKSGASAGKGPPVLGG